MKIKDRVISILISFEMLKSNEVLFSDSILAFSNVQSLESEMIVIIHNFTIVLFI